MAVAQIAASEAAAEPVARHPYRLLGSFRFLLALSVLLSHTVGLLDVGLQRYSVGNLGVMLFFVVSGFVIFEALDLFYRDHTIRFLVNRAFKIYPAYLAAVAMTYVLHSAVVITDPQVPPLQFSLWGIFVNITLLPTMLKAGNNLLVISVAWGVLVECQFYIAAAVLIALARRFRASEALLHGAGALALLGYAYVHATAGHHRFYGYLQFAPYFVLGASMYLTMARQSRMFMPLFAISLLLTFHAFFHYNLYGSWRNGSWDWAAGPPWHVIQTTIVYGLGGALMLGLLRLRVSARLEWWDKRLGDLTYALYIVHHPIISALVLLALPGPVIFLLCWVAAFTAAIAVQRWVERPLNRVRNRLRGRALYD